MPQPFLLLIAAKLAQDGFLGWKWSLCHVPTWLAVQRSKAVFFLTLYDSINDMRSKAVFFLTLNDSINDIKNSELSASHLSHATAIFVVDCCQFGPSWIFILSMIWNTSELSTSHRILPWCIFTQIKKSAWDTISNTHNVYLVLNGMQLLRLYGSINYMKLFWPTWSEVQQSKPVFLLTL